MEIVCHSAEFFFAEGLCCTGIFSRVKWFVSWDSAYVIDLKKDKDYMSKSKWNQRETEKDHKTLHKTESSYLKK